jgi:hypothetical protein
MSRLFILPLAALSLSGCDQLGLGGSSPTTDTNMRSVEIEVGTASDEMIILDSATGDGTAVDTSTAVGPAAPRPAAASDDDDEGGDDAPASGSGRSSGSEGNSEGGDQVIRPPSGGAEPDGGPAPAEK